MTDAPGLDKGGMAEEALRAYFSDLNAFVVRGVPFRQFDETISDIDLWVYSRASAYSRHITIVDIKNKKKAKPFERMLWIKGLQLAVSANEALVASSDRRKGLPSFAARLGVKILSREIFTRATSSKELLADRASYEELIALFKMTKIGGSKNLLQRVETSKSLLAEGISFGTLNIWIDDAAHFLKLANHEQTASRPILRAALLSSAFVALAADYLGRDTLLSDAAGREQMFKDGLLFGSTAGQGREFLDFAESAATEFVDPSGAAAAAIRRGVEDSAKNLRVDGLIEVFTRTGRTGRELYDAAIQFEFAAHSKAPPSLRDLPVEARSVLGALFDYSGLKRGSLSRSLPEPLLPLGDTDQSR